MRACGRVCVRARARVCACVYVCACVRACVVGSMDGPPALHDMAVPARGLRRAFDVEPTPWGRGVGTQITDSLRNVTTGLARVS